MRRLALLVLVGCTSAEPPAPRWAPGTVYPSTASRRGLLDRRGLIHAHSVYSHDACDGAPIVDGRYDATCLEDFRRGLCQVGHDFVMLTDHDDSFSGASYPEVLLYDPTKGDVLVERDGGPVASRLSCGDRTVLVLAGMEAGLMPVGLDRHADRRFDRRQDAEAIAAFKDAGALVLLQHTEDGSVEQIATLPVDGFEIYNLHANTLLNAGPVLELLFRVAEKLPGLPHPDLALVPIYSEDPRYIRTWSRVLARGVRRVGTMGTDCHRNTFPAKLADGERIDSYRRMMGWFSNHALIRPGADGRFDDRHLEEAIGAGRLYGVFEVMGYAEGFDFRAEVDGAIHEMGAEVPRGARLVVQRPRVENGGGEALIIARLLHATRDDWVEVARGESDLAYTATSTGAYRAEIRMRPRHLRALLGDFPGAAIEGDRAWVLANPIYVR